MNHTIKNLTLMAMLMTLATPGFSEWASTYTKAGDVLYKQGHFDAAIAAYTKAIEIKPGCAEAYESRGIAKLDKGDTDGAIADFTVLITLTKSKPPLAMAYNNLGYAKLVKGDYNGAIADMTKAIELKPGFAKAHANRGLAMLSNHDFDGAIADFSIVIKSSPNSASTYINRGAAKTGKGDLEGAITDFTKGIKLQPNYASTYSTRGCLRYALQAFKDALTDYRKAVELDPSIDVYHFRVWLVRVRLGEVEPATVELQQYLAGRTTGKPDDWVCKLGRFLTGQLPEPEFLASAKNPNQTTEAVQLCLAYFYAGSKHLIAGDKATATDYFQQSIATDQKDALEYISAVAELKFLDAQKN
jgi:tetratricopeptide (TPR) repeat protein